MYIIAIKKMYNHQVIEHYNLQVQIQFILFQKSIFGNIASRYRTSQ
jgi:hypothetical protein